MEIVPTVSSKTGEVTAGGGNKDDSESYAARYPIIEVQRLVTEFNMASGTTAVIGGLSRTVETQIDNGIPWLRNWWWIGPRIFGSKVRVKEQKEILAQNPDIAKDWDEKVGDRMIKLCIIGQKLDKKAISAALDACLA